MREQFRHADKAVLIEEIRRAATDRTEIAAWALFALVLAVYAVTRLCALDQFPIYFFADEAIEMVLAKQLLDNGLRDSQGHFFPFFFNTYGFFNPLISVYFHAIGLALFGKSIVITRATSAGVTLIGSGAVGFAYPAILCAAATFYSYGNGQLVIGVTGILVLLSDLRYHLKMWRALVPVAICKLSDGRKTRAG